MSQVIDRLGSSLVLGLIFGGMAAMAATPIATVRTSDAFQLDGHSMNTPGVTAWPLVLGDELTTPQNSPLVVLFRDGSEVKLAAASRAQIVGTEKQPKLVLLSGSLDFKLAPKSNILVTNLKSESAEAASSAVTSDAVSHNFGGNATLATSAAAALTASTFLIPASTAALSSAPKAAALVTVPPVSRHL